MGGGRGSGGGGSGSSTTTQHAEFPPEIRPLMETSSSRLLSLQNDVPLTPFATTANPLRIAPLSRSQRSAVAAVPGQFDLARENVPLTGLERLAQTASPGFFTLAGRDVPQTALERRAGAEIPAVFDLADRRVTGANLAASPSLRAAEEAFTTNIEPAVINRLTLAGLGRSTALPNALAQARAQYLLPLIEGELGREERGLDREAGLRLSAIGQALGAGAQERGVAEANIGRVSDLLGRGIAAALQTGATERELAERNLARRAALGQQAIDTALQVGDLERAIEQGTATAEQQDFLRRQALSEQALFMPFGALAPSAIGSQATTTTRQRGGGGGPFK